MFVQRRVHGKRRDRDDGKGTPNTAAHDEPGIPDRRAIPERVQESRAVEPVGGEERRKSQRINRPVQEKHARARREISVQQIIRIKKISPLVAELRVRQRPRNLRQSKDRDDDRQPDGFERSCRRTPIGRVHGD